MNLKEHLENIYDNLSERIKSPFIFTFIAVWSFRHWILVYSLFNFDKDFTLIQKLSTIKEEVLSETYCSMFWLPLLFTFISIISYFLLQFLAEGIVLTYKKWGRTFLYNLIDKSKLATKSELDAERKVRKSLDSKNKELEQRIKDYIGTEEEFATEISNTQKEISELKFKHTQESIDYARMKGDYEGRENQILQLNNEIGRLTKEVTVIERDLIDIQTQDGEPTFDLTEIFSPGKIWTFIKKVNETKIAYSKFYMDDKGQFFLFENKPIYKIKNVKIRDRKDFVEFDKFEIDGKYEYTNRLIRVNEDFLVGGENKNQICYIKGEYSLSNIDESKYAPLFIDTNALLKK